MTSLPRIDLDAAENLIKKIRSAEAQVAALYEQWNSLAVPGGLAANGNAQRQAQQSPVPVPRAGSLTGKILAAMKAAPGTVFTPENFARPGLSISLKKIKGVLEKLVFRKYIERVSPGHYRYPPSGGAQS
ncbi:MAG: hypothetical protein WCC27_19700 [Acidobacteriaceae bacterium]